MARHLVTFFQVLETVAERVVSFTLVRELGRAPYLEIDLLFSSDVTPLNAVGAVAYFSFGRTGQKAHQFAGIVEEATSIGSPEVGGKLGEIIEELGVLATGSTHAVRFRVVSRLGLLSQVVESVIFQDKDVQEIVSEVLERAEIPGAMQKWQLTGSYDKRPYCVQYQENALDFISRLLEEEGIYMSTIVDDGDEIIVFADDSTASDVIEGDANLPFRGDSGLEAPDDGVVSLREEARVCSGKFVLRDYDFERPALDLTATAEAATDSDLERYDYPGLYTDPARGKHLSSVRLEAEQAERDVMELVVDAPRLAAGLKFTLTDAPYDDMNGEYVVTRVVHLYGREANGSLRDSGFDVAEDVPDQFVANVRAIPSSIKFRTPQTTPRPVLNGPQTARVVGPDGAANETIHTDQHGRVKLKFHWDTAEPQDDKASFWCRTSQLQTSGSMVIPRLDWEVLVDFLEGNPDRPIVVGKLYNGLFMPPYALPEGRTRTTLKTASSPGGGGGNEIRMEDRAGGEEIFIKAQYNQTKATANDKKTTIGNNATRLVGVDESIEVTGDQSAKITMGSKLTVSGDQAISVGGNRNVEVNAVTGATVGGSQTITVGGNHFEMDGNPLKALLQIAAETAIAAAKAQAAAAMEKINEAVQSKVDQVMGPINDLTSKVEQLGAGMEALKNGDIGGIAKLAANAADLPLPPGFGGDAAGGGGEGGGGEGGEGGGEAAKEPSYTEQLGLDSAVDSAIEKGITAGAGALGEALGLEGDDAGGASAANTDGPVGDVEGVEATDRAKGPGHSQHKVGANYTETTGALRIQAAITGIHTEVAGNETENVSLAKFQAAWGNIATTVTGNQSTKALGQILYSKADVTESAKGAATTMIGGLLYDKVGGGVSIEAKAPATFIAAFHKWEAGTAITLKCGASEVVIDGSGVTITSPLVAILAGKIVLTKDVSEV